MGCGDMTLIVNRGHRGLDGLAGVVASLVGVTHLPAVLYVYGIGQEYADDIYLDDSLPRAKNVAFFIRKNTAYTVKVGLPTEPRERPAVAINFKLRIDNEHRERLAQILLFLLLVVNDKVNHVIEPSFGQNFPLPGDYVKTTSGRVYVVNAVMGDKIVTDGNVFFKEQVEPYYGNGVGSVVRELSNETLQGRVVAMHNNGFITVLNDNDEQYLVRAVDTVNIMPKEN
jgi:hypothetical protein